MTERPAYTEYHPRWYRPRLSTWWWLKRPSYFLFILRELSSAFVAWSVVYLMLLVRAVSRGQDAYNAFFTWAASPGIVVLNVVSLLFVTYHAYTWFNLAPRAMVVRFRGQRVPPSWIAGANYAAWAVASLVVLWIVLGG
jgi:fumarate reductase subunit C